MFRITLTMLVGLALSLPATAQTVCGKRGEFLQRLSRNYDEAPVAVGLVSNGNVIEVLVSESGSWTIILTRPDGVSCVVAAGEAWQDLPELVSGPAA